MKNARLRSWATIGAVMLVHGVAWGRQPATGSEVLAGAAQIALTPEAIAASGLHASTMSPSIG